MIAKEEIQKTVSKKTRRRTGTDILLGAFVLVGISGFALIYMMATSDNTLLNISLWWWAFIHRISALLSLIFTIPHVYRFRKWYKGFFSSKRKSKITVILSISFLITLLTTIVLAMKRDSMALEVIHSTIGIVAVIFTLTHALKRYHVI